MKPLLLQGHERPITMIKYNREGDLIFSASKDKIPNVWYSLNGERLGTFNGHLGSVWCIDVNWETTKFLSGSGDSTLRLWDCQTGKEIGSITAKSAVRTCAFSYSGDLAVYSTDKARGQQCEMFIIDIKNMGMNNSSDEYVQKITVTGSKVTSVLWGALDETLITGHEDGEINVWDAQTRKKITSASAHKGQINDMQFNKDGTMFITASKDNTAKLFDSDTLMHLKTYSTERPVNSATISPIKDHVVLGGGQDAMQVTTTSTRHGKFDARFYHLVFEEEFARLKGHFGPINSLAFHPNGRSFASGGEDGYTRINTFDQSYYDFQFEY